MSKAHTKEGNENPAPIGLSVSFIGDISFNGQYIELYKQSLDPFENLKFWLYSRNHVIGNLECLAKGDRGENLLKKPRLITTVETLNYLTNIHASVVCLAQNHVYDHLEDGFEKTLDVLSAKGIKHLGAGFSAQEAAEPVIIDDKGIKIGLLNYVTADTNPNLPPNAGIFLNIFNQQIAEQDISKLKPKVDHVVVLLHWGGRVEGGLFPDFDQPQIARRLIDSGADLIIGHHTHTFQPVEIYKGKHIFYSLGNFCFSEFIFENEPVLLTLRRRITGIVGVDFHKNSYTVNTRFFRNDGKEYHPLPSYQWRMNFKNFIHRNLLNHYALWKIYFMHKQYILPFSSFFMRNDIGFATKISRIFKSVFKKLKKT